MIFKGVRVEVFVLHKLTKNILKHKEKKVGVAGLQPTLNSLDYGKLLH